MKPLISLHDYGRPWKLFTLACGIALLIAGSYWQPAPDWDVPISLIMGVGTYFCAPVSTRIVARRRWKLLPLALFLLWLCVDGVYWAYWSWGEIRRPWRKCVKPMRSRPRSCICCAA